MVHDPNQPLVARRIVVGKMLIGSPCSRLSSLSPIMSAYDPRRIGKGLFTGVLRRFFSEVLPYRSFAVLA
jgi:hypothetical protein